MARGWNAGLRRLALVLGTMAALAGCDTPESAWTPPDVVSQAAYDHAGPSRLTLFTMINNRTGAGAHSSLMVNGSERVIFDPAGSFRHEKLPERGHVLYGITPKVADKYTRYHARETFRVQVQEIDVPPAVAQQALRAVQAYGPVPSAQCARSTSTILGQLFPGQVGQTWFPKRLSEDFGGIAGVSEQVLHEYDDHDNSRVLREWVPDAF